MLINFKQLTWINNAARKTMDVYIESSLSFFPGKITNEETNFLHLNVVEHGLTT